MLRPSFRPLAIGLAAIAASACSAAADDPRQQEIMTRIEAKIRLPAGASSLSSYARTYAYAAGDRVRATYFIPVAGQMSDSFCEGAKRYGPDNGQIALACPPPDGLAAGGRRWYRKPESLPDADDGGCGFIDIEFDLKTDTVISAQCHGQA